MTDASTPTRRSWCILQMAGPRTLTVVAQLQAEGLDVWTPIGKRRRHKPRSTKYTDVEYALLPTFAFGAVEDLPRLLALSHEPGSGFPPFRVFQRGDAIPTAPDAALAPLRRYEAELRSQWEGFIEAQARDAKRKRKKNIARAYVLGQRVHIEREAFAGLTGKITEIRNNGDLVLEFAGFTLGTTVPSCDVRAIHLSGSLSEQDEAA